MYEDLIMAGGGPHLLDPPSSTPPSSRLTSLTPPSSRLTSLTPPSSRLIALSLEDASRASAADARVKDLEQQVSHQRRAMSQLERAENGRDLLGAVRGVQLAAQQAQVDR